VLDYTVRLESPTQFAWACLQLGDYPPPAPTRKGVARFGPDADCWLCGGPTHGVGWPWRLAITDTFTNHTLAKAPHSQTVCQPCAALASKQTWGPYVAAHPEKGLKTGHAVSWRNYSHVFAPGLHDCPTRAGWRHWLLNPPEPPFLFVISTSQKKHLIFRARVACSRDVYPLQFEEVALLVERAKFRECLAAFDRLFALGFSSDGIVTGRYHPAQLLKVGVATWREAERAIAPWRSRAPYYLELCAYITTRAQLEDGWRG